MDASVPCRAGGRRTVTSIIYYAAGFVNIHMQGAPESKKAATGRLRRGAALLFDYAGGITVFRFSRRLKRKNPAVPCKTEIRNPAFARVVSSRSILRSQRPGESSHKEETAGRSASRLPKSGLRFSFVGLYSRFITYKAGFHMVALQRDAIPILQAKATGTIPILQAKTAGAEHPAPISLDRHTVLCPGAAGVIPPRPRRSRSS